jgi:hypothetical protein
MYVEGNIDVHWDFYILTLPFRLYCLDSNHSAYLFQKRIPFELIHIFVTHLLLYIVSTFRDWKQCIEMRDCLLLLGLAKQRFAMTTSNTYTCCLLYIVYSIQHCILNHSTWNTSSTLPSSCTCYTSNQASTT